jgi:tetratricopeptide (TPR) repeat protein
MASWGSLYARWRTSVQLSRLIRGIPKTYNNRGIVYAKTGRLELALEEFSKAIRLDPEDYKTYNNRGSALRDAGLCSCVSKSGRVSEGRR